MATAGAARPGDSPPFAAAEAAWRHARGALFPFRLQTWLLLARTWRRLSSALLPYKLYSVLSASLFVTLLERAHLAGEWVVGGVEAK